MSTIKETKDLYSELKKDKYMIILLRVLLLIIVLFVLCFSIIFIIMVVNGKHVKFWTIEYNIPTPKKDTIFKYYSTPKDTVYKFVEKKVYVKDVTPTINAKNFNNAANYGNQVVGDVTINKPLQRQLDDNLKKNLVAKLENFISKNKSSKNVAITIGATLGNEEARTFAIEIANFLNSKNFNVVNIGRTMGNEDNGFNFIYSEKKVFFDVGSKGLPK